MLESILGVGNGKTQVLEPSNHNILANNEWLYNIGENREGALCMLKEDLTAKMTFE